MGILGARSFPAVYVVCMNLTCVAPIPPIPPIIICTVGRVENKFLLVFFHSPGSRVSIDT